MSKVHVSSEIGELKRVIVHRPDEGIERVSPRRAEELLFDDIVYLPQMQSEHDVFTSILKAFLGEENVLETQQLIFKALENDAEGKREMIDMIVDFEELPNSFKESLSQKPHSELAEILITDEYANFGSGSKADNLSESNDTVRIMEVHGVTPAI